ncbi:MAG: hypothetical protein KDD65_06160 [Bacteroidetes bacterium]|nr:hypothetical protein [Bacteroidota bacterium]
MPARLLVLMSVALLGLVGCSGNDATQADDLGSFSVAITGSTGTSFSGDALIQFNPFVIALGHGTVEAIPMYFGSGTTQPTAGTYAVDPNGGTSAFRISVYVSPTESYRATSGTITINSSTASEVTGQVAFSAERNNVSTTETINVSGTFRAVVPE